MPPPPVAPTFLLFSKNRNLSFHKKRDLKFRNRLGRPVPSSRSAWCISFFFFQREKFPFWWEIARFLVLGVIVLIAAAWIRRSRIRQVPRRRRRKHEVFFLRNSRQLSQLSLFVHHGWKMRDCNFLEFSDVCRGGQGSA